jgi:hypothetical protein
MKEKIKVVILPTGKLTYAQGCIVLRNDAFHKDVLTRTLLSRTNMGVGSEFIYPVEPHYVYITISQEVEDIKVGDWFINEEGIISICTDIQTLEDGEILLNCGKADFSESYLKDCRKIIATTDPKLTIKANWGMSGHYMKKLPQLQQSFIKEFVANPNGEFEVEYVGGRWDYRRYCAFKKIDTKNTDNPIDYVWVKGVSYESIKHLPKDKIRQLPLTPKLNQDNTVNINLIERERGITITSVEEKMYSKKGLLNKLSLISLRLKFHSQSGMFINKQTSYEIINWIEENL